MLKPQKDVTIYIYRREGKKSEELLKSALEAYWDRPVLQLPKVERTDKGKPYFSEIPELHFSISHSEELIAIAFSDSNCGVDIEKIKLREFKRIADRMKFNAETLGEFYQEWTKYEATYSRYATEPL